MYGICEIRVRMRNAKRVAEFISEIQILNFGRTVSKGERFSRKPIHGLR
jgi:hypothetical protein